MIRIGQIATFFLLLIIFPVRGEGMLPVDSLSSEKEVQRFYKGCLKIMEGERTTDRNKANKCYAEAMDLLNTRSTYSQAGLKLGSMKLEKKNDSGLSSNGITDFAYDYKYARSKYKNIDFAPSGITRGYGNGCRVTEIILKPKGTVVLMDQVSDDCILIALAQPERKISLEVVLSGGEVLPGTAYGDDVMSYIHWDNGASSKVEYRVTNLSEEESLVTLIGN